MSPTLQQCTDTDNLMQSAIIRSYFATPFIKTTKTDMQARDEFKCLSFSWSFRC